MEVLRYGGVKILKCGGMEVWWCGGVVVWRCGGVVVLWCGGVVVWWCDGVVVWWCDGVLVWKKVCPELHLLLLMSSMHHPVTMAKNHGFCPEALKDKPKNFFFCSAFLRLDQCKN